MMKTKPTKHVDKLLQQGKGRGTMFVLIFSTLVKKRFGIKLLNNFMLKTELYWMIIYHNNKQLICFNSPQQLCDHSIIVCIQPWIYNHGC